MRGSERFLYLWYEALSHPNGIKFRTVMGELKGLHELLTAARRAQNDPQLEALTAVCFPDEIWIVPKETLNAVRNAAKLVQAPEEKPAEGDDCPV